MVDEVIINSVYAHLERQSFSNTNDIASLFEKLKLPQNTGTQHFAILAQIMKRRHNIVHRADLSPPDKTGTRHPTRITGRLVGKYAKTIRSFVAEVIAVTYITT
jgi:hypothetical protein